MHAYCTLERYYFRWQVVTRPNCTKHNEMHTCTHAYSTVHVSWLTVKSSQFQYLLQLFAAKKCHTHQHTHNTNTHTSTHHAYIHTPMHTHTHAYIYTHTYTHTHPCIYTHTHAHTHTHAYMHTHTYTHIHTHTHEICIPVLKHTSLFSSASLD